MLYLKTHVKFSGANVHTVISPRASRDLRVKSGRGEGDETMARLSRQKLKLYTEQGILRRISISQRVFEEF